MNLPENQQTTQTDWRAEITRLRAVDGWKLTCGTDTPRLVPVKGKNPGVSGAGWQDKAFTLEQVTGHPEATGCGLVTGPQPTGDSVICIDFDGYKGVEFAKEHGVDPAACSTWQIVRTGADGQTTKGRAKFLFRTTPEQRKQLGEHFTLKHTIAIDADNKQEGIEVFHHGGRQVVVLGAHPEGGHYFWPEGRGPEALKVLPDDMLRLIKAVAEAAESGISALTDEELKQRRARLSRESREWRRMAVGEACPICGRDGRKGDGHICATRKDDPDTVRCFDGVSFTYKQHGTLAPGSTIQGRDGQLWAFTSEAVADGIGMRGNFRVHRPRSETVSIPAVPQPWTVASDAGTTTWDTAIGLPEAEPASTATVDVTTGPATLNGDITKASAEAKAKQLAADYTDGRYTDEQATDLVREVAIEAGRLEARAGQRNTISNSVKLALGQELVGPASSGALIGANTWRDLVKTAWLEEAQNVALEQQARDMQRRQEALALAQEANPTLAPLLRMVGHGHGDHLSAPEVMALAKRLPLRWNIVRRAVEFVGPDGTALELDGDTLGRFYMVLAEAGHDTSKQAVADALRNLADRNHYNPIAAYLSTLEHDPTLEPFDLDRVATDILGVTTELEVEMVKRWLIAAVARGLRPGTKVDSMLVLMGEQGQGKSTFFEALVPDPKWFRNYKDANHKDWLITMHRCWIYEMQEVDSLNKKDAGEVKGLITINTDTIRAPYGHGEIETPRHSVMGGSCNRDDFLRDETGSRRFWVVDLRNNDRTRQQIHDAVHEHREAIWKAALAAYREGERWWLTDQQEVALAESNAKFEPESPLEAKLTDWASTKPSGSWGSLASILVDSGAHTGDVGSISRPLQNDAAKVMRILGWVKGRPMVHGVRVVLWAKAAAFPDHLAPHLQVQPSQRDALGGW